VTALALEDEFLALLCEDEEALRAEFDAIISANWDEPGDEPPPALPPRPPAPRTPYRFVVRPLRTGLSDPIRLPRQRSPPNHATGSGDVLVVPGPGGVLRAPNRTVRRAA
jgi:hypothetical protein